MTNKASYLVQVMEKIGSPLIASVNDVSARLRAGAAQNPGSEPPADNPAEDASNIAALLNKSVQVAISMSQMMDLSQTENESDSVRLALTALAGPMLANQYRMSTRIPGEADIKKIVSALEAVMTFSDNFSVGADANIRLEKIDQDFFPVDEAQIQILYIQALVPMVNAVVAFPFGFAERKLVQDVTERLLKKAEDIRKTNYPELKDSAAKKSELAILRSLATIYSQCHFGEMARLMSLPPEQRENQPTTLDPVWKAFEARADMLEVLARESLAGVRGQAGLSAESSGGGGQAPMASGPEQTAQQATAPPQQPPPSEAPQTTQQTTQQTSQQATQQTARQTAEPSAQQPPPQKQPPQQQGNAAGEQPVQPEPAQQQSPNQPPVQPPQEPVENSAQSQQQDSSSGNPMAFFKKPNSTDETQNQ